MADDAQSIIDDARSYAANTLSTGLSAMQQAIQLLEGMGAAYATGQKMPVLDPTAPTVTIPQNVPAMPDGAQFTPDFIQGILLDINAPQLNTVPGYQPPPRPTILSTQWDDLVYVDPSNLIPAGVAQLNAVPPTLAGLPTIPTAPPLEAQIMGLTFPTVLPITIPAAPAYNAPVFSAQAPVFSATMPTGLDLMFEQQFNTAVPIMQDAINAQLTDWMSTNFPQFSTAVAAIEARLATYLAGGTALTPAVEDALYTRTLDKTNKDAMRAAEKAYGEGARAGHVMPGPMILSQQVDIDYNRRMENAKAATEIYIKQAELEQSNLQFAVKASNELRQIALTAAMSYYHGLVSVNQQALEYARGVVDAVVKAFDIAARYAEVQTRIYEAAAVVYRAQLEGAIAVLHAYESQVRGLEAQANVDRALVDAFRAQIDAIKAEADVYTSQINAIVAVARLSEIQVQLYDAQVKAFVSQINAYTAQWQGYKYAVEGQVARMNVNLAHAKEYEAAATAYAAEVHAAEVVVTSAVAVNKELVDIYKQEIEAYAAYEGVKEAAAKISLAGFDLEIKAFVAQCTAAADQGRANVASYEAGMRGLIAEANMLLEQIKEANALDVERIRGVSQVSQTIGNVYGRLAEAAMAGQNTLAAEINTSTS